MPGEFRLHLDPRRAIRSNHHSSLQKRSLLFPVEDILGGIGYSRLLAHDHTGFGRWQAAHRIQPLNVAHAVENARPFARGRTRATTSQSRRDRE